MMARLILFASVIAALVCANDAAMAHRSELGIQSKMQQQCVGCRLVYRTEYECKESCKPRCGVRKDGTVQGGVGAIFQAQACMNECVAQCRKG